VWLFYKLLYPTTCIPPNGSSFFLRRRATSSYLKKDSLSEPERREGDTWSVQVCRRACRRSSRLLLNKYLRNGGGRLELHTFVDYQSFDGAPAVKNVD